MALIWKKEKATFDLLFTLFSHQAKDTNIPSAFALPILQKLRIYHAWFLFGVTPGADSYSRHFGAINK